MLSANFKPKRIAAASRGFLGIARLSCNCFKSIQYAEIRSATSKRLCIMFPIATQSLVLLTKIISGQGGESTSLCGGETSRWRNVLRANRPAWRLVRGQTVQMAKRPKGETSRGRTDEGAKRPVLNRKEPLSFLFKVRR